MRSESPQSITFRIVQSPYSLDPIDYDHFAHHQAFTASFATLVTQYRRGHILGVIAKSWLSSDDLKTWTFELRDSLTYSNGDPITPSDIAKSLKRITLLQRKGNSHSGMFEYLIGVEKLSDLTKDIEGISITGNSVILQFTRPIPRLLETISFGLYGITHPSDYDPKNGAWIDQRRATTSGAYRIDSWEQDSISLSLRKDFPAELHHPNPIPSVVLVWGSESEVDDLSHSDSLSRVPENFQFVGTSALSLSIAYVQCYTWSDPHSPCSNKNTRKKLRELYYDYLRNKGIQSAQSFFPMEIVGAIERTPDIQENQSLPRRNLKIAEARSKNKPFVATVEGLSWASSQIGLDPTIDQLAPKELLQAIRGERFKVDIGAQATGILVSDAALDVRFMIQSREGICLPDPTGRLKQEAKKETLDYRKLDEILWDDAIIWPLAHFRSGLAARKGMFDFSMINLDMPATDISWIGKVD